jgi:hypothetical protein
MFADFKKQNSAFRFFDFLPNYDGFVKSHQLDDTVKSSRCKAADGLFTKSSRKEKEDADKVSTN